MASPARSFSPVPVFRTSKKRKIYRQRTSDASEEIIASAPTEQSLDELIAASARQAEDPPASMSEILRLRKARKPKVGGVEFRVEAGAKDDIGTRELMRGSLEKEVAEVAGLNVKGFAKQHGMVGDEDKHMMAYIDSEIAKRRYNGLQVSALVEPVSPQSGSAETVVRGKSKEFDNVQRAQATMGKLQEVELGDEARDKNVERTDKARRKLEGELIEEETKAPRKQKVRLGRDGKPWRGRKKRASEDIARDKLVEDILRENRLDLYEEPMSTPAQINDNQAADDQVADAFRRDFLDAVAARQHKKAPAKSPPRYGPNAAAKKVEEELMKGPKLGGSRSARAAMREQMLKGVAKKP